MDVRRGLRGDRVSGWSVCPVCAVVVADQDAHNSNWHAPLANLLSFLANVQPQPPATSDEWAGDPVTPPPPAPTPGEVVEAAAIRAQVPAALLLFEQAKPALDAFAALAASGLLTAEDAIAHIPVLNQVTNGLLDFARDTACVLTRTPLPEA